MFETGAKLVVLPLLSKISQFVTLSLETFFGLGTGKFDVRLKTGVVSTCCPAELSSGGGMSSS